jgi:hypothetical protein
MDTGSASTAASIDLMNIINSIEGESCEC